MTHPFRCPECPAPDDALEYLERDGGDGAFVCAGCGAWFPVEDAIADFAPAGARDDERWRAFWERHGSALGLREPPAGPPSVNAQTQRAFFDGFADDYDRIVADTSFWRGHDALAVLSWVEAVPADAAALDLGAGSGRCTVPLADRMEGGEIVSMDISFEMLRRARAKLSARGTAGRVRLVVADCTRLRFLRAGRFDVAFSYGLLHHLDDPESVWRGLERVMRPRSNVLIHDNNASAARRLFDLLMRRRRLWDADHEGHPVIRLADLRRWAEGHGFDIRARTSVFVPPHLCNRLSPRASRRLLAATDAVANRVPGLAGNGGLVLAEAFRGGPPLVI